MPRITKNQHWQKAAKHYCASILLFVLYTTGSSAQIDDFIGTWSGIFTTKQNEFWQLEDHACFVGCTPEAKQFLAGLLDDPANDKLPIEALFRKTWQSMQQQLIDSSTPAGLALRQTPTVPGRDTEPCRPNGVVREIMNPLPMVISRVGENLVFQYEEWGIARTIDMDSDHHPADLSPTPMGHSIGRMEGTTLVIETAGISPDRFHQLHLDGQHSDQLSAVERYNVMDDPKRLTVELAIEDQVVLQKPFTLIKLWLNTPHVQLAQDQCTDIPGKP